MCFAINFSATHILLFNFPINGFEIFFIIIFMADAIFVVEISEPTIVSVGAEIFL